MTAPGLRLAHWVNASVDEVFGAWTDAERLGRWLRPSEGHRVAGTSVDARNGGGFEIRFAEPASVVRAKFHEFDAQRTLAFALTHEDGDGVQESHVRVVFQSRADGTAIELSHDGLPAAQHRIVASVWQRCLGLLIAECSRAVGAYYDRLDRFPRFHSRFGGFWTDLSDGDTRLLGKRALGLLDDAEVQRFRHWREKGYVVIEGAVPGDLIDALRTQLAHDWERGNPAVKIELCEGEGGFHPMAPALRDRPHKVLDYHATSSIARDVQFAPPIRRFLTTLFERPPTVFQSLLFRWGTEQAMHQDTAYVVLRSPMEFVGCWIALEDVAEGSGELQYFEGSHRIPEYLWFGRARARPPGYPDDAEFLAWVKTESERAGCPLVRFRPKKGDALLWHADLVHGGSKRVHRGLTRWSLVSHFCPVDVDPIGVEYGQHSERREHTLGCWYSYSNPYC